MKVSSKCLEEETMHGVGLKGCARVLSWRNQDTDPVGAAGEPGRAEHCRTDLNGVRRCTKFNPTQTKSKEGCTTRGDAGTRLASSSARTFHVIICRLGLKP